VQVDFDVLNCDISPKRKPEVDLRRCGRHLENRYDVITRCVRSDLEQNHMPMTMKTSKCKPEV